MNRTDSDSQVDEGVTVVSCRNVNRLLLAVGLVLLASSKALKYRGIMSLQKSTSAHPASERQYTAAGEDVPVPWGGGGVFTSDGKRNKEIDARIGKANAVLREFYRSVVTKRELSNTCQF